MSSHEVAGDLLRRRAFLFLPSPPQKQRRPQDAFPLSPSGFAICGTPPSPARGCDVVLQTFLLPPLPRIWPADKVPSFCVRIFYPCLTVSAFFSSLPFPPKPKFTGLISPLPPFRYGKKNPPFSSFGDGFLSSLFLLRNRKDFLFSFHYDKMSIKGEGRFSLGISLPPPPPPLFTKQTRLIMGRRSFLGDKPDLFILRRAPFLLSAQEANYWSAVRPLPTPFSFFPFPPSSTTIEMKREKMSGVLLLHYNCSHHSLPPLFSFFPSFPFFYEGWF